MREGKSGHVVGCSWVSQVLSLNVPRIKGMSPGAPAVLSEVTYGSREGCVGWFDHGISVIIACIFYTLSVFGVCGPSVALCVRELNF